MFLMEVFQLFLCVSGDLHEKREVALLLGPSQLILLLEGIALLSERDEEFLEEKEISGRFVDFLLELIQGVMVEVTYSVDLNLIHDE